MGAMTGRYRSAGIEAWSRPPRKRRRRGALFAAGQGAQTADGGPGCPEPPPAISLFEIMIGEWADQTRSNRSRFITFVHAAMNACAKRPLESELP